MHYTNESEGSFDLYESNYPAIAPPSDGNAHTIGWLFLVLTICSGKLN